MMEFLVQIDPCTRLPATEEGYQVMMEGVRNPGDIRLFTGTLEGYPVGSENACPVGTVEFVEKYLGYHPEPLDLFDILDWPAVRKIHRGTHRSFLESSIKFEGSSFFVKGIDRVKSGAPEFLDIHQIEGRRHWTGDYLFSEVVSFECEWRVWVMGGRVIDYRPYLLENQIAANGPLPNLVPHFEMLKGIATTLEGVDSNLPFSVDIGLVLKPTPHWEIVEAHHCYSLGLYGMDDPKRLAIMLWRTYTRLAEGRF